MEEEIVDTNILNFEKISGEYDGTSLNLQDAMNMLMSMAGSTSFVYIGDTAPEGNKQYALWLDTSGQE